MGQGSGTGHHTEYQRDKLPLRCERCARLIVRHGQSFESSDRGSWFGSDTERCFKFANTHDRIAINKLRNQTEALFVGHPHHRDDVSDDEHDVLGHLSPGHRAHTAEHRAKQNAEQAEPHTDFKRDLKCASGNRTGCINLRGHVGEGRNDEDQHGQKAGEVTSITRTDEVGHGVTAELAQIWRHQRSHKHVAAGPAHDECHVAMTAKVDAAG